MKRVRRGRRGFGLADLLVVVGLIPLLSIAFLACSKHQWQDENRVACAGNPRRIGIAIQVSATQNNGAYPRTSYVGGDVVHPVWGTAAPSTRPSTQPFAADGPKPNDVSAALFLLLPTQWVSPATFVCPSCCYELHTSANSAMSWSNWQGVKQHLSYSYANPYPDNAARNAGYKLATGLSADFAIAADMNPGTVNGSELLTVTLRSSAPQIRAANSRNHYQNGQNVLYADGHVTFQSTPFCGVRQDNIYTRR